MSVTGIPTWRRDKAEPGQQFEFVVFDEDVREVERLSFHLRGDGAARSKAGRIAKRNGGPVDLAYAGNADWNDRYITTASPCLFSKSGYRFERIA